MRAPVVVSVLGLVMAAASGAGGCIGQSYDPGADLGAAVGDRGGPGPGDSGGQPDGGGEPGAVADTTGLWAMRVSLKVKANVIGMEQELSSTLILLSRLTEDDAAPLEGPRDVTLATQLCDFQLPQIPGFPARLVIPTELLAAVGEIPSRAVRTGGRFQGDPQAVTIGVVLGDPLDDDLPAPVTTGGTGDCGEAAAGQFCDQEADGKPGGTLLFDPPFNAGILKLARVYAAARTVVQLAGTLTAGGAAIVGQIPAADLKLETLILGCQKCEVNDGPGCDGPADCDAGEVSTVAALNPDAMAEEGSELVAVRLDEALSCDEIIARQSGLFR